MMIKTMTVGRGLAPLIADKLRTYSSIWPPSATDHIVWLRNVCIHRCQVLATAIHFNPGGLIIITWEERNV